MIYEYVILGILLVTSVFFDICYHRIPNLLLLFFFLSGLLLPFFIRTCALWSLDSVLGFLFPVISLYGLFYIRGLGAGDIKLLAVIGYYTGVSRILRILFFSMAIGAVYGMILVIYQGSLRQRWNSLVNYVISAYRTGRIDTYPSHSSKIRQLSFSIPIATAYLSEALLRYFGISFPFQG